MGERPGVIPPRPGLPPRPPVPKRAIVRRRALGAALLAAIFAFIVWAAVTATGGDRPLHPRRRPRRRRSCSRSSSRRASRAGRWRARITAVRKIAQSKRAVTPKLTAQAYLDATARLVAPSGFRADAKGHGSEGFLFPSTYEFLPETTAKQFVAGQLAFFRENWAELNLRYASKRNLTPYDVLIIASMVEKETVAPDERPLVAAVIYNRLQARMPLGIDATIRYGLNVPATEPLRGLPARERQPLQHAPPDGPAADADRQPRPRLAPGRRPSGAGRLPLLRAQARQGAPLLHRERAGVPEEGVRVRLRL